MIWAFRSLCARNFEAYPSATVVNSLGAEQSLKGRAQCTVNVDGV